MVRHSIIHLELTGSQKSCIFMCPNGKNFFFSIIWYYCHQLYYINPGIKNILKM